MKKSLSDWQIGGFLFTCILGVILHFLFDWTNQSIFVAPFSAVNESIWEHLKLLFFPMFAFSLIEKFFIGDEYDNFWCVKQRGIVFGLALIPVLYYIINGIFGPTPDWVNIAIFFVSAAVSYLRETHLFNKNSVSCKSPTRAFLILCLILLAFVVMTFNPPHIPLFKDPVTNTYGYIA